MFDESINEANAFMTCFVKDWYKINLFFSIRNWAQDLAHARQVLYTVL